MPREAAIFVVSRMVFMAVVNSFREFISLCTEAVLSFISPFFPITEMTAALTAMCIHIHSNLF